MRKSIVMGAILGALLATSIYSTRGADDESGIVGLDMAGPSMAAGTPAMWFGVKACTQYVIFIVMDDGHMWQVDDEHHPKDMEAFINSIASVHHQLKIIPCSETV